jgi:Na+-driven multidrug efflux pump
MSYTLFFILNLIGTWIVAEFIGKNRKIGYRRALITCFLLTPIIGGLIALISGKTTKLV